MPSRVASTRIAIGTDRHRTAVAALLLFVVAGAAYLVGDSLAAIARRWEQPELSHGYLIPVVAIFVLWQRRAHFASAERRGGWLGAGAFAAGLALALAGGFAGSPLAQGLAFLVMTGGFGLALLGRRPMSSAWAPLAFLLFALPLPGPLYIKLSLQLQLVSSEIGALLLRLLGVSVFLDGNIIDLGVYQLQVAEACSGLSYLFPLASFGVICAWLYRGPLWAKAVLCAAVLPITVLMNSVRIALTGALVNYGSIALAEGFLHLFEGWVLFLAALALLFLTMALLTRLRGRGGLFEQLDFERAAGGPVRHAAPGAPLVRGPALFSAALLALVIPVHHALADPAEATPVRPGLVTFPADLGAWSAHPVPIDRTTLNVLEASDYLLADYVAPDVAAPVNLWIAYYDSQVREALIHSPRECLPGAGWEFVDIETVAAPAPAQFALNRAKIANGRKEMLMYYWYEQRGRQLTSETWIRLHLLKDAFTTRRSDGGLVRIMTPILPDETQEAAERRLERFFRRAYSHLEPHLGA